MGSGMAQRWQDLADAVFAAWSSGDPDAPKDLLHPDAVLWDVASGRFEGWPAIRGFFGRALDKWSDLQLAPDEYWFNDTSLVVHYVMSATVLDASWYGPDVVGRRWEVEVMSSLRFDDDLLVFEADFHDKGARARSLGLAI